ncbi:hypothetical protein GCM10025738_14590 [Microbacterium fluvii]
MVFRVVLWACASFAAVFVVFGLISWASGDPFPLGLAISLSLALAISHTVMSTRQRQQAADTPRPLRNDIVELAAFTVIAAFFALITIGVTASSGGDLTAVDDSGLMPWAPAWLLLIPTVIVLAVCIAGAVNSATVVVQRIRGTR